MRITLVATDDWKAVYLDDTLYIQGYDISAWDILEIIDKEFNMETGYIEMDEMYRWGYKFSNSPLKLKE